MLDDDDTPTPTGSLDPSEAPAVSAEQDAAGQDEPGQDAAGQDAAGQDAAGQDEPGQDEPGQDEPGQDEPGQDEPGEDASEEQSAVTPPVAPMVLFKPPETRPVSPRRKAKADLAADDPGESDDEDDEDDDADLDETDVAGGTEDGDESAADEQGPRRRRRRGGRRRRKPSDGPEDDTGEDDAGGDDDTESADDSEDDGQAAEGGSRRRRRRRRTGDDAVASDAEGTGNRTGKQRSPEDEITGVSGSTRLEAKKQRRREGREAGRRRAPIVSEAEFLARRESVDRVMVIRQRDDLTQIGVLEDKVLVEHYVSRESQTSMIGNVYLGRVQNVLPSMEAAFIDIGKGRNAVLYAGEVNWSALGQPEGQPRKVESVLSSGQPVLVQVTKDPVGHKGARLTGQISLPGRFLVYVPDGNTSGISRKLPDTERNRLKNLLKEIVPESAGVIVRTAAEGASEDELTRDVERLTARWKDIEQKVESGKAPQLLYGEPDLTLKVVRDLFTEDITKLVVQGDDAWDLVDGYVSHVAPDLRERLERFEPATEGPDKGKDLLASYRVDEQIAKGMDRKVWLPSGGSLIIERTEAMTVVDVNTGKFTGSGGNLEETVTKNNLEAAEEIVRQLRLRDIGGIIVIDFIDMVLESNRELVLRRLVECLGRDRTRHQVAEVTSLGLVQMTRKRIGTGLLEAFSSECEQCKGRGVLVHEQPVEQQVRSDDEQRGRRRSSRSRRGGGSSGGGGGGGTSTPAAPSPADLAASRPPERPEESAEQSAGEPAGETSDTQISDPADAAASRASEAPATDQADEEAPAPRVVATTRRRGARRPAGPPQGETAAPGAAGVALSGIGGEVSPHAEPADIPVEPAVPGHSPGEGTAREADGAKDPGSGEDSTDDSGGSSLLHVPIKKKGSRKR